MPPVVVGPMTSFGSATGWGLVVAASLMMGAVVASRITLPERVAAPAFRSRLRLG